MRPRFSPHPLPHALPLLALAGLMALAGCSTTSSSGSGAMKRGGGDYRRDGPSNASMAELAALPDPLPAVEPLKSGTMKPYAVMGRSYRPMTALDAYDERGVASWYGRQFHGLPTASGEPYDMHQLSAAHTTLPIPSWARVTNLSNGRSTILRINDRGPFKDDRLLDLSYAAAAKLDVVRTGSAPVRVELLLPTEIARIREERGREPTLFAQNGKAPVRAAARRDDEFVVADSAAPVARPVALPVSAPASATVAAPVVTAAVTPAVIAAPPPPRPRAPVMTPVPASPIPPEFVAERAADRVADRAVDRAAARGPDDDVPSIAPSSPATPLPVATAPAPASEAVRADLPPDATGGTWLQLGAFSSRDNAEAARSRVAPRLGALGDKTRVVLRGSLFRVHVGPFASRDEATTAREELAIALGEKPVLVDQP